MLPTSWFSLIFFVVLIAPGLVFDLLRDRRRIGARETTFREISRVVLASGFFSILGFGVLAAINALVVLDWLPKAGGLLGSDANEYIADNVGGIAASLLVICGASVALAYSTALWFSRKTSSRLTTVSAWTKTFRPDPKVVESPYVHVRLTGGTVYRGRVADFTADLELADRELVLWPPISIRRAHRPTDTDRPAFSPIDREWQRLVLRASDIESILVRYEKQSDKKSPRKLLDPRTWWTGNDKKGGRSEPYREIEAALREGAVREGTARAAIAATDPPPSVLPDHAQ